MLFEIKSRWTGNVQFSIETDNWRLAVEAAYKTGAVLTGADLTDADLRGAVLRGAVLTGGIKIKRVPLQLSGLHYYITIWDSHMQIGCEFHSLAEWAAFDDEAIKRMDPKRAMAFWHAHKDAIFSLAKTDGRE